MRCQKKMRTFLEIVEKTYPQEIAAVAAAVDAVENIMKEKVLY